MTERGRDRVSRDATWLKIGPSAMTWDGDTLRLELDEVTAPWPRRVRGTIEVACGRPLSHRVDLDEGGRHRWGVIAPHARIQVALDSPRCAWSGSAYLDSNRGDVPLEDDFRDWSWSRAHLADGRTAVVYDVTRRRGPAFSLAHRFDEEGNVEAFDAPPIVALPRSRWGLERSTRSSGTPTISESLEDGPFYTRSIVDAEWLDERVTCVHEQIVARAVRSSLGTDAAAVPDAATLLKGKGCIASRIGISSRRQFASITGLVIPKRRASLHRVFSRA